MLWKSFRYVKVLYVIIISFLLFYSTNRSVNAMRVVLQRVKSASVITTENNQIVAQIGYGIVALIGIHIDDTITDVQYCCHHILNCKLWNHDITNKPWKLSVKQKQYDCLLVSQFYCTINKKSSYIPDYKLAMKSIAAKALYDELIQMMTMQYGGDDTNTKNKIQSGVFGTMMDVSLINDGPVTIIIDSRNTNTSTNNNTAISNTITTIPTTTTAINTNDNNNDINNNTDEIES